MIVFIITWKKFWSYALYFPECNIWNAYSYMPCFFQKHITEFLQKRNIYEFISLYCFHTTCTLVIYVGAHNICSFLQYNAKVKFVFHVSPWRLYFFIYDKNNNTGTVVVIEEIIQFSFWDKNGNFFVRPWRKCLINLFKNTVN